MYKNLWLKNRKSSLLSKIQPSASLYKNFKQKRYLICINPLPNNTILPLTKLKAFADNNFYFAKMVQFFFERIENIIGKGKNAVYQHFPFVQSYFWKVSLKTALCGQ